jgi:hypothetical protein
MTSLEMNVLQMADEGYSVLEICAMLDTAPRTVREIIMQDINATEEGEILCTMEADAEEEQSFEEHDQFRDDVEADADALASVGWGTDEDYGYYGEDF